MVVVRRPVNVCGGSYRSIDSRLGATAEPSDASRGEVLTVYRAYRLPLPPDRAKLVPFESGGRTYQKGTADSTQLPRNTPTIPLNRLPRSDDRPLRPELARPGRVW